MSKHQHAFSGKKKIKPPRVMASEGAQSLTSRANPVVVVVILMDNSIESSNIEANRYAIVGVILMTSSIAPNKIKANRLCDRPQAP